MKPVSRRGVLAAGTAGIAAVTTPTRAFASSGPTISESIIWHTHFESMFYSAARIMNTQPAFTKTPKSRIFRAHALHSLAHSLRDYHCLHCHLDAQTGWKMSEGLAETFSKSSNLSYDFGALDTQMRLYLSQLRLSSRNQTAAARLQSGVCSGGGLMPERAYRNLTPQTIYRHWGWQIYLLHQLHQTELETAGIEPVDCSSGPQAAGTAISQTSLTIGSVMAGNATRLAATFGGSVAGWGFGGIAGALAGWLIGGLVSNGNCTNTPINWSSPYMQGMPPSYMQSIIDYNQLAAPPSGTPISDNYTMGGGAGGGLDDAFAYMEEVTFDRQTIDA